MENTINLAICIFLRIEKIPKTLTGNRNKPLVLHVKEGAFLGLKQFANHRIYLYLVNSLTSCNHQRWKTKEDGTDKTERLRQREFEMEDDENKGRGYTNKTVN